MKAITMHLEGPFRGLIAIAAIAAISLTPMADAGQAVGVPTFNCISLYWDPAGGASTVECTVNYRVRGSGRGARGPGNRIAGQSLWFDPVEERYKGSLVNLEPGRKYDIELSLAGTTERADLSVRTWREKFPVRKRVKLPAFSGEPLVIAESGSSHGYVLYTFADHDRRDGHEDGEAIIDVGGVHSNCISVADNTKYVIIRGLTLKGASRHAIELGNNVSDIVIEQCDISGWGSPEPDGWGRNYDSAVFAGEETAVERIIIQDNRIHHPATDSNNWAEYREAFETYHPIGPQGVAFFNSLGNHVIRFNEFYSDEDHYFNDVLGAGFNFSQAGFPNCDSDIYGNYISNCWDDAIESEGANENVRIWGNFIEWTLVRIAVASTTKGPAYVFRNVSGIARANDLQEWNDVGRGGFLKTSDLNGGGRIYVYHNTILQPEPPPGVFYPLGCSVGLGHGGPMLNVVSRNNILHVYKPWWPSIFDANLDPGGDYDYDLYSGVITAGLPTENSGIMGEPIYAVPTQWDPAERKGDFSLSPDSLGYDSGQRLPNFNDGYSGGAPDIGAHEALAPHMRFGVRKRKQGGRTP